MDYRKLLFGPTAKLTNLAVDEQLRLVAVASVNGFIKIYSEVIHTAYSVETGTVTEIQFVQGKGCLVASSGERNIHVLVGEGLFDPLVYRFVVTTVDVGLSLSLMYISQMLTASVTDDVTVPLLTIDKEDGIELVSITGSTVARTSRTITRVSSHGNANHILQVAETEFKDEKLTILLLWSDCLQMVRFNCRRTQVSNSELVTFDLDHIVCCYATGHDILHVSVITPHSFIVSTTQGQYCTLNYDRSDHSLSIEDPLFPYGPFPCRGIAKCVQENILGVKKESYIFSSGLPAVTYNSLNSLSVALKDEPEICFTFFDPIIDFAVVHQRDTTGELIKLTLDEIVVATQSQVITISQDGANWRSSTNYHFSPISRSAVTTISNTVEMDNVKTFDHAGDSVNDGELSSRYVATFHEDGQLLLWNIAQDNINIHATLSLEALFSNPVSENLDRKVLWPQFQKCGVWKNAANNADIKMNCLKLIPNCNTSFYVLCSIQDRIILYGIIFLSNYDNTCDKSYCPKRIHINISGGESLEIDSSIELKENLDGGSSVFKLLTAITLSDSVDLSMINTHDSIIVFGVADGVGLVNTISGKYLYMSSEELNLAESSQSTNSLSELIRKRLRKRTPFESLSMRKYSDAKSQNRNLKLSKLPSVTSFHLFPGMEGSFDLLLGFSNGLVMILSFTTDEDRNFVMDNNFRRLSSKSRDPVISLSVIANSNNGQTPNAEEYMPARGSIDSTKGSSPSIGSKSTTLSIDSGQANSDLFKGSSIARKLSLKRPQNVKRDSSTNLAFMRCDRNGVKMIDYVKLKTRFKFKIKQRFEKEQKPNIIQGHILIGNQGSVNYLLLLCYPDLIMKLTLPNLESLGSYDLANEISLISINQDNIIIPRLVSIDHDHIPEILVLDQRKRIIEKKPSFDNHLKWLENQNKDLRLAQIEKDHGEIDFMRCAEPSINSLLW